MILVNILDVDNLTANVALRICSTRPCDRILSTRNAQAKVLIKWTLLYRTQGSKVCACVTLQNCLIWVTNNHTVKAFNQRVSGGFHVLGKAQNSMVTQQDTRTCQSLSNLCVLKVSFFSLSLPLFPLIDLWELLNFLSLMLWGSGCFFRRESVMRYWEWKGKGQLHMLWELS